MPLALTPEVEARPPSKELVPVEIRVRTCPIPYK